MYIHERSRQTIKTAINKKKTVNPKRIIYIEYKKKYVYHKILFSLFTFFLLKEFMIIE